MAFAPDREELAWAAGFFDGEGCFCYSEAARYVSVSIGQTNPEPLERFRNAVGLGKINGPYLREHPNRLSKKPQWVYQAYGVEKVQAIAAMLWFKLGSIKREQAMTRLRRAVVCARGHRKKAGHKGCATCQSNYWRTRRDGTLFEQAAPYWAGSCVDLAVFHAVAGIVAGTNLDSSSARTCVARNRRCPPGVMIASSFPARAQSLTVRRLTWNKAAT
jgi:hypothetical protein